MAKSVSNYRGDRDAEGATEALQFDAAVAKVQTLSGDGGVRITLDLPEQAIEALTYLALAQQQGIYLEVTCRPEKKR